MANQIKISTEIHLSKPFKSTRPITSKNFRYSSSKETTSPSHLKNIRYLKTRSLNCVNTEKASKEPLMPKKCKKYLFSYESIPNSTDASFSQTCVMLSIFKERPATVMVDYPPFCNLKSKVNSQCILMTVEQSKRFKLKYKFTKRTPIYNCILNSLEFSGFKQTKASFNILISAVPKNKSMKFLTKYQKYNHFPGSWHLGRKDSL